MKKPRQGKLWSDALGQLETEKPTGGDEALQVSKLGNFVTDSLSTPPEKAPCDLPGHFPGADPLTLETAIRAWVWSPKRLQRSVFLCPSEGLKLPCTGRGRLPGTNGSSEDPPAQSCAPRNVGSRIQSRWVGHQGTDRAPENPFVTAGKGSGVRRIYTFVFPMPTLKLGMESFAHLNKTPLGCSAYLQPKWTGQLNPRG